MRCFSLYAESKTNKLVGNVGQKCHLACSLYSNSKLSLVKSASTANAAGKDLSSLGNELSELSNILVIDLCYLVLAEDANLLLSVHRAEGSARSIISLHDNSPFRLKFYIALSQRAYSTAEACPNQKGRLSSLGISSKFADPAVLNAGAPYAAGA